MPARVPGINIAAASCLRAQGAVITKDPVCNTNGAF